MILISQNYLSHSYKNDVGAAEKNNTFFLCSFTKEVKNLNSKYGFSSTQVIVNQPCIIYYIKWE